MKNKSNFLKKETKKPKIPSVCDNLKEVRQTGVCTSRTTRAAQRAVADPLAAKAVETLSVVFYNDDHFVADPLAAKAVETLVSVLASSDKVADPLAAKAVETQENLVHL